MKKIATPDDLQSELRSLMAYSQSDQPSRGRIASELRGLADRLAGGSVHTARSDVSKPLYGHDSEQNAYVVDDYPYGRLRTQKRFWMEKKGKRGWRMVGQTLNPKTGRWNKPKAGTYSRWAGVLYLDSQGHVHGAGLHEYSDVEDFIEFAKTFPRADLSIVKQIVPLKIKLISQMLSGERYMTMNGVRQDPSEAKKAQWAEDLKKWETLKRLV